MNEIQKKNLNLDNNDKFTSNSVHGQYNMNSFRGYNSDKNSKQEKEVKIISPRVILQSGEKEGNVDILKMKQLPLSKPRLLTGKLPSAFDVRYRRYVL
jgi:hypothetical protein